MIYKTTQSLSVKGVRMTKGIWENCPACETINTYCSCPKTDCKRHGICCECIMDHKKRTDVAFHVKFPHCLRDQLEEIEKKPTRHCTQDLGTP